MSVNFEVSIVIYNDLILVAVDLCKPTYIFADDPTLGFLVITGHAPFVSGRTALVFRLLGCHSTLCGMVELEITLDGTQIVECFLTLG